ncbi:MAG: hypothetical protein MUO31_02875 [Thermodesulfovibrionales bacterium]|jgi:hypothetical protein|nr:hypothetical protein [Thermodesulfovibrionales bacterium]
MKNPAAETAGFFIFRFEGRMIKPTGVGIFTALLLRENRKGFGTYRIRGKTGFKILPE